jgi:hypothetical protein
MLKTTLVATLIASTAALSKVEVSLLHQKTQAKIEEIKYNHHHNGNLAKAAKSLKVSSGVSLKASGIATKSTVRTLRGKAGKGKGKGKDDDKEDDASRMYLTYQVGYCAGVDLVGDGPIAEAVYLDNFGYSNECADAVTDEGIAMSSKYVFTAEPFSVVQKVFQAHECMENYYMPEFDYDETADFDWSGMIPANGVCTDTGYGYSVRLALTDTPALSSSTPTDFSGLSVRVNDCMDAASKQDGYGYNEFYFNEVGLVAAGTWTSFCEQEYVDGSPTAGVYMNYDPSACGNTPPSRTITYYSTSDCTGTSTGSMTEVAKICTFDWIGLNQDLTSSDGEPVYVDYNTFTCHPGA